MSKHVELFFLKDFAAKLDSHISFKWARCNIFFY